MGSGVGAVVGGGRELRGDLPTVLEEGRADLCGCVEGGGLVGLPRSRVLGVSSPLATRD